VVKNKFLNDLSAGQRAEAMVQTILHNAGMQTETKKGSAYDILAKKDNEEFTIEVKFDIYAARSGNIAIEYYNPKSNIPSGLTATQADLWAHIITKPMSVWLTSVKRLKKFVESFPPHRVIDCGGDKNASLYLYKQDIIFDIFHRIDECDSTDLHKILQQLLTDAGVE
jgi:hypothetical protein